VHLNLRSAYLAVGAALQDWYFLASVFKVTHLEGIRLSLNEDAFFFGQCAPL
jgi:hypothetical protein